MRHTHYSRRVAKNRDAFRATYLAIQAPAMIAHFASYAPLFRHRLVEFFARFVEYLRSLGRSPIAAAGSAAAVVALITTLGVPRALFVPEDLLLLVRFLCFSQRDGRRFHSCLYRANVSTRPLEISPLRSGVEARSARIIARWIARDFNAIRVWMQTAFASARITFPVDEVSRTLTLEARSRRVHFASRY